VDDWSYAQMDNSEELAQLRFFSVTKKQPGGEVTFRITVKEFATPPQGLQMRFFAQADKHVNQKTAPVRPCGWGESLGKALSGCLRMIRQFPFEGEEES
jgi:hypothetical protein